MDCESQKLITTLVMNRQIYKLLNALLKESPTLHALKSRRIRGSLLQHYFKH